MRKITIFTVILTAIFTVIFSVYTNAAAKYDTVTINYLNKGDINYGIIYNNGRIYVPFYDICNNFGIEYKAELDLYRLTKGEKTIVVSAAGTGNKTDMYFDGNNPYVYLYKVVEPFGEVPVVDIKNKKININESVEQNVAKYKTTSTSPKNAYIRLEDIMADGMDSSLTPKYDTAMLEKLMYTGKYLYECSQSYYIAWIPVYANPKAEYWNDVSANFNLYNAYFVYVLDYLTEHNGHLGLHGYTHQYGNYISAVGNEWGKDTPFSAAEQENRMKKAIECADRLGLDVEFFEFPHYSATNEQIKMAEKYFDLIYQSYPSANFHNRFIYTDTSGKKIYFLPTPADYVHSKFDVENTINRLANSINSGLVVSLYYHPVLDFNYIEEITQGNKRIWSYSDGALPQVLNYISDKGYIFSPIDK